MKIKISTTILKALLLHAGKDTSKGEKITGREHLAGLAIEVLPNGRKAVLIATDGARMAAVYEDVESPAGWVGSFIVPRDRLDTLCKLRNRQVSISYSGEPFDIELESNRICVSTRPILADFPDWRLAMPRADAIEAPANYNPKYLQDMYAITKAIGAIGTYRKPFTQYGTKNPGMMIIENRAICLIMPLRDTQEPVEAVPEWAKRPADRKAA